MIARTLVQRHIDASVFLFGRVADVKGDARTNLNVLGQLGIQVVEVTDAHAWPRPFTTGPAVREYAIGLGRRPPDAAALASIVDPRNCE